MSFIEENAAIVDKDKLMDMYHTAINHSPYSFFFVNLNSKDVNSMFYINFEKRFSIKD